MSASANTNNTTNTTPTVRTIRLNDQQVAEVLDRLDSDSDPGAAPNRGSTRFRYRVKGLVVHLRQPGASTATPYLVPTRNIGRQGLSFLHGGFVHKGTRCLVQLVNSHGAWTNVIATVVHCRYIESNVHEVGIRFNDAIDPAEYRPDAVRCRMLLVEDDPFITRFARFHLEQLNAVVDHAENGRKAIEMAMAQSYDVILMDLEMPLLNGEQATRELRRRGYTGKIVAATAMTGSADRERCVAAGCDRYLPKPYTKEDLSALLASL